jgi:transposase
MVDKMLKNGLNCVEIADVLDKHPDTVRDIKARYELPREEKKDDD